MPLDLFGHELDTASDSKQCAHDRDITICLRKDARAWIVELQWRGNALTVYETTRATDARAEFRRWS